MQIHRDAHFIATGLFQEILDNSGQERTLQLVTMSRACSLQLNEERRHRLELYF